GVSNSSSSPDMDNVTATALGGTNNYGVSNSSSSPDMDNVTATASGGTSSTGVSNSSSSSPTIKDSEITGSINSLFNTSTSSLNVFTSQLDGPITVGGGATCLDSHNGAGLALSSSCGVLASGALDWDDVTDVPSALVNWGTGVSTLSGGGTFINNSSFTLNSVLTLSIPSINRDTLNTVQSIPGSAMMSGPYNNTSHQFGWGLSVDCVMLETYNSSNGDFELVLSGALDSGSEFLFINHPTDTIPVDMTVSLTGDKFVGRLKRLNGVVSRSNWTSGYENCIGDGEPSLYLDGGAPISQGTYLAAEFSSCGTATLMPTCASFVTGEYNDNLLTPNRTLAGELRFQD
ncbi:MAG: hypothetical protein ACI9I4_001737, partial [Neolewinella sp.]